MRTRSGRRTVYLRVAPYSIFTPESWTVSWSSTTVTLKCCACTRKSVAFLRIADACSSTSEVAAPDSDLPVPAFESAFWARAGVPRNQTANTTVGTVRQSTCFIAFLLLRTSEFLHQIHGD